MSSLPHLLVVDDDREIRDLVKRFLTKHGFRVTLAEDAISCMAAIEAGKFDLVVLDVMMPGEDGLSVCRRVRATSDLPVIMLTAMGEETDRIIGASSRAGTNLSPIPALGSTAGSSIRAHGP